MSIYYENGCFSLWQVSQLDELPKAAAKKIAKMIGKNRDREENEECILTFCEWIAAKIELFSAKVEENRADKDAEKALRFYIALSQAALF